MSVMDKEIKDFVQETLKIDGLITLEQLTALISKNFGEQGKNLDIPADKKKKFAELLDELNQEIKAARIAHESYAEEAKGYQMLAKPFTSVFDYVSENVHTSRAKGLAAEAAKFFVKEGTAQFIRTTLSKAAENGVKDLTAFAKAKTSSTAEKAKKKYKSA